MRNKTSAIFLSIFVLVSAPGFVVGDFVKDIAVKAAEATFSEAEEVKVAQNDRLQLRRLNEPFPIK